MTTALIRETLEEIIQEGDPESVAEARAMLRYADAADTYRSQLAATDDHCRRTQAHNRSVPKAERRSYADGRGHLTGRRVS